MVTVGGAGSAVEVREGPTRSEERLPFGLQAPDRELEPVLGRHGATREVQAGLVDQPVLLARVATPAGGHHVVPGVRPAARARDDVIEVLGGGPAVLAP